MEKNYQFLDIEINKPIYRKLNAVQYDNNSRYILVSVYSNFKPYDLTYATVKIYGIKKDKTVFFNNAKILDAKAGKFEIDLTEQCLAVDGDVEIQILILGAKQERLSSNSFILNVKKSIIEPAKVTSQNEWGALTEGLASLAEYDIYKKNVDKHTEEISDLNNKKANTDIVRNKYFDGENALKENNSLDKILFRRKHSLNIRKKLKYSLAYMSFERNFIDVQFSDLYPNLEKTKNQTESVENNQYTILQTNSTRGQIRRVFSGFNLFSSYEFEAYNINGGTYGCRTGFSFIFPGLEINIMLGFKADNKIDILTEKFVNGVSQGVVTHSEIEYDYSNGIKCCITNFNDNFELYLFEKNRYNFKQKIEFQNINSFDLTFNGKVALYCRQDNSERITFKNVSNSYDCGLTQGDMKPIRYRNGSPVIRDNKIFFTTSSRFNEHSYQTIISKTMAGCDYKLEGVLLFEYNKTLCSDIASSIIYDNEKGCFLIWNTAFSQGHFLGYGTAYCDILQGVNIISMETMLKVSSEAQPSISDDKLFFAKRQDEDPDFIYNEATGKWNMIICRTDSIFNNNVYNYFLFESDDPFVGYTFVDKTVGEMNVTGGTITKIGNEYFLIFGAGNNNTLIEYYYAPIDNLSNTKKIAADHFDGGFRGWGTIIPVQCGSFTKYGWITFDRSVVSSDNHSYGNIYYFESNLINLGNEFNVKYSY